MLDRIDLRPPLRAVAATAVEAGAVVCTLLGFVAAVGYLYRADPLYRVGAPSAMSLPSALGFMLAGGALAALVPGGLLPAVVRSNGSGGLAARRLLPVAVALPILFGWLWQLGLSRNIYGVEVGLGLYTVANVVALSGLVFWAREHLDRAAARERAELDQKKATLAAQRALQEKEVLLREVHHRVKNNLQVISSLLNLQMRQVSDGAARLALAESRDRVHSIALVHQKLHQSEGVAAIELGDYIVGLINDLLHVQAREPRPAIAVEGEPLRLPLDLAVPCGLIVNELVTNALKYAFPDGRRGSIKVTVAREADKVRLAIADDGVGLPPEATVGGTRSLGLNLVAMLCDQIDAAIEVERSAGTRFVLRFSVAPLG